jgi:hypothetical protein
VGRPAATPTTSRALLAGLQPFGPTVEVRELVLAADPPADLLSVLGVLHTGLRALLTGRQWWGASSGRPRVVRLDPDGPIPAGITLLCVEGDPRWDRIDPAARLDHPKLFAPR